MIDLIDGNNKPISEERSKDDVLIPKGFINIKKMYKGREYKEIDEYVGVWVDTGELFKLEDINGIYKNGETIPYKK